MMSKLLSNWSLSRVFFAFLGAFALHRLEVLRHYYWTDFYPTYFPVSKFEGAIFLLKTNNALITRGVLNDIFIAFLVAAASYFLLSGMRRKILLSAVVMFVVAAVLSANIEHIIYNGSHLKFGHVNNALSFTFISAQATPGFFKNLALFFIVSQFLFLIGAFIPKQREISYVCTALVVGTYVVQPIERNLLASDILQASIIDVSRFSDDFSSDPREFTLTANANANDEINPTTDYNVLLVFMEGISNANINEQEMPNLSKLKENNLSFDRYFGNALITANGLYSSLLGDYPNIFSQELKWEQLTPQSEQLNNSIALKLHEKGYQTTFMQSAPLAFMKKGTVLPMLGFKEVIGDHNFTGFAHSRNSWGVDDRTFFKNALDVIEGQDEERHWFMSLLTTGTHSPYNVPADYQPSMQPTRSRAIHYLDYSVNELIDELDDRGILDNTVVILTSDESRATLTENPVKSQLSLHWLPLIIMHPESLKMSFNQTLDSRSLRHIVKIALDDESSYLSEFSNIPGQSLILVNHYSNKLIYYIKEEEMLLFCHMPKLVCRMIDDVKGPLAIEPDQAQKTLRYENLEAHLREISSEN